MTLQEMISFYMDLQKQLEQTPQLQSQITALQAALVNAQKDKADNINALQDQIKAIANERDSSKASTIRDQKAQIVIRTGLLEYGKPYVFSAARGQNANFDCSSFTQWSFKKALGISLHGASYSQAQLDGRFIDGGLDNALIADLLCYDVGSRDTWEGIDHVGLYTGKDADGNHTTLHTYKVGIGVVFEKMTDARIKQLKFIKRVIE